MRPQILTCSIIMTLMDSMRILTPSTMMTLTACMILIMTTITLTIRMLCQSIPQVTGMVMCNTKSQLLRKSQSTTMCILMKR